MSEVKTYANIVKVGLPEWSADDQMLAKALQKETGYYKNVIAAAHNNIGLLRAERQDFRAAAEQFRAAQKWDPGFQGVDFNLGLASYKAEQYGEAVISLALDRVQGKEIPSATFVKHVLITPSNVDAVYPNDRLINMGGSDSLLYSRH